MDNPRIRAETEKLAAMDMVVDQRIYFLGLGAIGKLIAHSFTDIPEAPPMTLLFRDGPARDAWIARGSKIELIRNGISDIHPGFDAELARGSEQRDDIANPIENLIVATKATFLVAALYSVKHRLRPSSTIVFLQNGMGWIEEVNEKVFPDIDSRPNYVIGIVSHAAVNKSPSSMEHIAIGNIALVALAKIPLEDDDPLKSPVTLLQPSTRYLMRTLTRTPLLGAIAMPPEELLQVQLEKLANNCIINPLTAILNCKNGDLLHNRAFRLVRLLLAEISLVIRAMPELESIPDKENRFRPASLERNLTSLIVATAKNRSSMLQDLSKGRLTEIDYLNGYIFRRGEELGIRCMVNYTVMSLLRAKSLMTHNEYESLVPIGDNEAELEAFDDGSIGKG